jgi:hypothetical protein
MMATTSNFANLGREGWIVRPYGDDGDDPFAYSFEDSIQPTRAAAETWVREELPRLAETKPDLRAWAEIAGGEWVDATFDDVTLGIVNDADLDPTGYPKAVCDLDPTGGVVIAWYDQEAPPQIPASE